MPLPASRAEVIAARLSAAGFEPRVKHFPRFLRVEIDPPSSASAATWRDLLAVLETADRFGLKSNARGCTAWALIDKSAHDTTGASDGQPQGVEGV